MQIRLLYIFFIFMLCNIFNLNVATCNCNDLFVILIPKFNNSSYTFAQDPIGDEATSVHAS